MLDLGLLRERLGDDHVVLLRLHPFVRAAVDVPPELATFAIDASDHPEINELLMASDVLVTDYSSVIFEYALLRRPMLFFAPDLDAYEAERGFYFDYRTGVPGPVMDTTEAIAAYLRAGTVDLERIDAFRAWAFEVADGRATERFVERIVRPALAGRLPRRGPAPDSTGRRRSAPHQAARARSRARSLYDTALPVHVRQAQPASSTLPQDPRTPMTFRAKPVVEARPQALLGEPRPTQLLPQPGLRPGRGHRHPHPPDRGPGRTTTTTISPRSGAWTASPSPRPTCATARPSRTGGSTRPSAASGP